MKIKRLPRRCYTCKYYKDGMCWAPVKPRTVICENGDIEVIYEPNPVSLHYKRILMSTKPTLPICSCEFWKPKIAGQEEVVCDGCP